MEWFIAFVIASIGILLAVRKSTWLVDYAVLVFVLNRCVRRLVDFYFNHAFNPLSPISLTPLVIAGAMALVWLSDFRLLPKWAERIFVSLAVAIGYAFVIGLFHAKLGAVYALGEVLAAISLAGFAFLYGSEERVRDRWIRSFAWGAIFASAYGWYQYLTIPPWDAFWVQEVGFVGYLGQLQPTKMVVFSTMAERGVLGGFLGFAVVPMIVSPRWRTFLGWPAVVLIVSVILLTTVRSGLIIAVIGALTFLLINRGANLRQVVTAAMVFSVAFILGFERIPGAERIAARVQTLGNLRQDGSYQGRVEIMAGGFSAIAGAPLGQGLGAAGLGTRVVTGTMQTTTTFGDAGYFQIAMVYGIAGTGFLLWGLVLAWKRLRLYFKVPLLSGEHVMLARALMVTMIPACWVGDVLTGFSVFWLALGCALVIDPRRLAALRLAHSSRPLLLPDRAVPEAQLSDFERPISKPPIA